MRAPKLFVCVHTAAALLRTSEAILGSVEDAKLVVDLGRDLSVGAKVLASPDVQCGVARLRLLENHRVRFAVVGKDVSHIYVSI